MREILSELGFRYRVTNRDLPGSPDLANRAHLWAVFVHGCFWHSHDGCPRATVPKRNHEFWVAKFAANRLRDARATIDLRKLGFRVLTVWECELKQRPRRVALRVESLLLKGPSGNRTNRSRLASAAFRGGKGRLAQPKPYSLSIVAD